MLDASAAIESLDKDRWSNTKPEERLKLLQQLQLNLYQQKEALAGGDAKTKNTQLQQLPDGAGGDFHYTANVSGMSSVVMVATRLPALMELYKALIAGKPFQPASAPVPVGEDLYDITVSPCNAQEKVLYGPRIDKIRIKGTPVTKTPYEKDSKVVAILGAGNFISPYEILHSIFLESSVAVYKPHPLYESVVDEVWSKILQPLLDAKALAITKADQGAALTTDARVEAIHFTGGVETAKKIQEATQTPLVCEAGGVNPTLIVPGDREWTQAELTHHAQQIVSGGKFNGGAICARPQLIVTCQQWHQREAFLQAIEGAIRSSTYAEGSYYPGTDARFKAFREAYPDAKEIQPEENSSACTKVLLITGDKEDGYSSKNEAFCQVFAELPLDTKPNGTDFLQYAVNYCNDKVFGSLVACIMIDETTRKNHKEAFEKAVTDLRYGTVGINLLPLGTLFNPYLAWQGHDDANNLESGRGYFGTIYGYENIEKSILDDAFVSPGQIKALNRKAMDSIFGATVRYYLWPSWFNLLRMLGTAIPGSMKGRDW